VADETFLDDAKEAADEPEEKSLPVPFDPLKTYLAEVSKYSVLSREEEFEIGRLVFDQQDRDAAQKLAMSNLRLVVKTALEYYNTYLNILDLIQEGNVGLLHAVKKYNPYKGTRFSSYASFWIRAYMLKYIMDSWSLVKVGTTQGQRRLFYRLNKEKRKLEAVGIYPSPKILASTFAVREEEVTDMQKRLAFTDVSLETPLHDGSGDTIMDTIGSDEDVEEVVSERQRSAILSKKVMEFKSTLNDRDLFIFDHRVLADQPMTLQEIGAKFNISRERVRQVEVRVLKKCKAHFEVDLVSLNLGP
jgi:RNA polymerase sigma-32 factor